MPLKMAKNDIIHRIYLAYVASLIDVFLMESEKITSKVATKKRQIPCAMSPYMTPKRKGKVTHPNTEGFTSL